MKKKLLLLILPMLLSASYSNAQSKTWDFGNDAVTWPLSTSGIGTAEKVVDHLGLHPLLTNTNFGLITASSVTFPQDNFTAVQRFQMNGAGFTSATGFVAMPVQRYLFLDVDGPCTVGIWFKSGSSSQVRTVYLTDGTNVVGSGTTNTATNATDYSVITANYTGAAGRLYIYGDTANNLYKLTVDGANVTTAALASNNFKANSAANVYSNGKQVSVTNLKSECKVKVYNMAGAEVKSLKTKTEVNFNIETPGVYVVRVESADGTKSVKVAIK